MIAFTLPYRDINADAQLYFRGFLRESCGPRALRHVGGELVLVSGCALVAGLKPCLCQQRWYGEQVPHSLRDRV